MNHQDSSKIMIKSPDQDKKYRRTHLVDDFRLKQYKLNGKNVSLDDRDHNDKICEGCGQIILGYHPNPVIFTVLDDFYFHDEHCVV